MGAKSLSEIKPSLDRHCMLHNDNQPGSDKDTLINLSGKVKSFEIFCMQLLSNFLKKKFDLQKLPWWDISL